VLGGGSVVFLAIIVNPGVCYVEIKLWIIVDNSMEKGFVKE